MAWLVFDIETNGLLDELTTIHCISLQEVTPEGVPVSAVLSANRVNGELTIEQALEMLQGADAVVGHNIVNFDVPAIRKLYPKFKIKRALDTMLLSTLLWPDLRDRDFQLRQEEPRQVARPVHRPAFAGVLGLPLGRMEGRLLRRDEGQGPRPVG
ncbi:ribonuclease H-like domain-containing protein [Xanthomonas axonopodis]|uniref:ribonuclease H-like domain-containing protein n=1 Tax=Xanthomonas axonopodis TaxID=53413 RepID=UPI0020C9D50F|nr:ribonuclease H-like domain-containing protein [Xanthomonas axonopodis]